jgi:hypothetical protein
MKSPENTRFERPAPALAAVRDLAMIYGHGIDIKQGMMSKDVNGKDCSSHKTQQNRLRDHVAFSLRVLRKDYK